MASWYAELRRGEWFVIEERNDGTNLELLRFSDITEAQEYADLMEENYQRIINQKP